MGRKILFITVLASVFLTVSVKPAAAVPSYGDRALNEKPVKKRFSFFLSLVLIIPIFLFSFSISSSASGWIYQNIYPTSKILTGVKFVTPQKGWIIGVDRTILHTEDERDAWEAQESGTKNYHTNSG